MIKSSLVNEIDMTADKLVSALLSLAAGETVCILDSCGIGNLGSHLLIAGIDPVEVIEVAPDDNGETLALLDEKLSGRFAGVFTLSYDLGAKIARTGLKKKPFSGDPEPDVYLALFDVLVVHDYDHGTTRLVGNAAKFALIREKLLQTVRRAIGAAPLALTRVDSNFTKTAYLAAVETIRERIRRGDTYQTNLTQQLTAKLPDALTPEIIFERLRRDHPAPFAAYIKRNESTVVSISPERFFCIDSEGRSISTSPIKGTRQRGQTPEQDAALRAELLGSGKDRAENTMIVDLLRNDLGRVCEYGSVRVESLCEIEEHPTLFHLVSTVSGKLSEGTSFSQILSALFPCGSITGAPKISTMRIIDEIETADRGLSMGAIGYYIPGPDSGSSILTWDMGHGAWDTKYDLSVAIRTMVIRDQVATFNVGGGIVIDSDPGSEYDETLTKAKALLAAIGAGPRPVAKASYLATAGQGWKLKLFVASLIAGGAVMAFGFLNASPNVDRFAAMAFGGALFCLIALTLACIAVRCPKCKTRLLWKAMREQPAQQWYIWLTGLKACPACPLPPVD